MAATKRPELTVEERPEKGSRPVRRLRKSGFVPGVVYGGGSGECRSFKVDARELRHALHAGSAVIDLRIGGDGAIPVMVKDQQLHPVRSDVMHVDLIQVNLREKVHAPVALEVVGVEEAPGVKGGGVLEQVTRELNVEALPTDIPENITVDVSHLEAAATMHLSEVTAPEGVVFLDDPEETIIATITIPTEEPEEPEVEEETGLVGEGEADASAEGAAQAEGATGDEASGAGDGDQES
ncbi:MAG: large subunit ribosomal protein [Thermoleophilaceae bacterium]|jgi:large subunit ribosomal protein L25|nr:large subunit ribosomal protein [Thermoleophilaceae bacterium]